MREMQSSGDAHRSRLGKTVLWAAVRQGHGEPEQGWAVRGRQCSRLGRWLGEDAPAVVAASFSARPPCPSFSFPSVAVEKEDTEAARVLGSSLGGFLRGLR
jgi:hypothetical protein